MKWNKPKHFAAPRELRYVLNGRGLLTYRRSDLRKFASRLGVDTTGDKQEIAAGIESTLMMHGIEPGEIAKALGEVPQVSAPPTQLLEDEERERHEREVADATGIPGPGEAPARNEDFKGFDPFEQTKGAETKGEVPGG